MLEKCPQCDQFFESNAELVNHIKKDHPKNETETSYDCPICPKKYHLLEELLHHLHLEHKGISPERLEESAKARETKKQLGEYIGKDAKYRGVSFDCPECYEMFSESDKLNEHRKTVHRMQFTEDAKKKLKELPEYDDDTPPQCEKCNKFFYGLVICKMDGKPMKVCFNCYEDHYGVNALRQLTIGTPDDILSTLRKPIT